MSRSTQRQRFTLSVYLVTAVTLVGLGGELLLPGHHVHVGDPAGHHHHFFTGPHHHQTDAPSRGNPATRDDAAGTSIEVARLEHSCHPNHESDHAAPHPHPHPHAHGHGHDHPHEHGHAHAQTPEVRVASVDDGPASPRGPPSGEETQASDADEPESSMRVASARQAASASEPARVPDPSEPSEPHSDSTHDTALIDSGFSLDDPTPHRAFVAPQPRPTRFAAIADLEFADGQNRRPGGARAPPSSSLV